MANNNHDTLVYRLAQILVKLNQGERLDPHALSVEFGVNLRTVQRDLNVRFAYLPLQKTNGRYHLDATCLGKLSTRDIDRFASLAGVRGLFPSLSDEFLQDIFDARMQSALLVKGHSYESLVGKEKLFRLLEKSIISRRQISFDYAKHEGVKSFLAVSPYKLINNKGIWYLSALDGNKLKTFSFTKIENLQILDDFFSWDSKIDARLDSDDSVWHSVEKLEVVMKVSHEVADYFKRRKLVPNQVIENELEDGDLIISTKIGHPDQILPIVRYWIPHISIISPEGLQIEMEKELAAYMKLSA